MADIPDGFGAPPGGLQPSILEPNADTVNIPTRKDSGVAYVVLLVGCMLSVLTLLLIVYLRRDRRKLEVNDRLPVKAIQPYVEGLFQSSDSHSSLPVSIPGNSMVPSITIENATPPHSKPEDAALHLSEFPMTINTPGGNNRQSIFGGATFAQDVDVQLDTSQIPHEDHTSMRSSIFFPADRSTPDPGRGRSGVFQLGGSKMATFHENDVEMPPVNARRAELKYLIDNAATESTTDDEPPFLTHGQPSSGSGNTLAEISGWAEAAAKMVREGSAAERAVAAGAPYGKQPSLMEGGSAYSLLSAGDVSDFDIPDFEERVMSPQSPVKSRVLPQKAMRSDSYATGILQGAPTLLKAKLAERRLKSLMQSHGVDVREVQTGPQVSPNKLKGSITVL